MSGHGAIRSWLGLGLGHCYLGAFYLMGLSLTLTLRTEGAQVAVPDAAVEGGAARDELLRVGLEAQAGARGRRGQHALDRVVGLGSRARVRGRVQGSG